MIHWKTGVATIATGMFLATVPSLASAQDLTSLRGQVFELCLADGEPEESCNCGLEYIDASFDDETELQVLDVLVSMVAGADPSDFAEQRGMTMVELEAFIQEVAPTIQEIDRSCR